MAKLVSVVREEHCRFGRRQLPLRIDDNLIMIMQLNDACLTCDRTVMKGKDLERFIAKYNRLSDEELAAALSVNSKDLFQQLSVSVPCIGCRRSVERLFMDLVDSGYPALEPLYVTAGAAVTLVSEYQRQPKALATLFHVHAPKLGSIIKALPKSKKNQRCVLHSLDIQKSRPLSNWLEVWETMSRECREAVVLIEADMLLDTLDAYLRKHRFCVECRNKVLRAYHILVGDADPSKEKGYLSSLYEGIRICPPPDKHIHVQGSVEFIDALIARAEPELMGNHSEFNRRERHAKTIEIAQEEVLTCLGICLYERLHKIQQRSCEEELTWELLFCLAVEALQKNFELAIEDKQGVSQLELLCEEMEREEQEKLQRQEQKRLKKKQRKQKDKKTPNAQNGTTTPTDEPDSDKKDERLTSKKERTKEPTTTEQKPDKSFTSNDVAMTTVTTTVIRRRSDGCIGEVDPRHCVVVPGYDEEEEGSNASFQLESSSFEEVKSSKKSRNHTNASTNNATNRGASEPSSCVPVSQSSNGAGNRKKRRNRQATKEAELARKQDVIRDQKNQRQNVQPPRFAKKQQGSLGKLAAAKKSVLPLDKPVEKSVVPTPAVVNGSKAVNGKDDYGYCSSSVSSSSNDASEGSDICSEGFCNHESSECTAQCDLLGETNSTSSHDESSTGRALNSPDVGKMFETSCLVTSDCGMRTCDSPSPFSSVDSDPHQHPRPGYMTLLQMLAEQEQDAADDTDEGESLIPEDEITRFQSRVGGKVEEKRAKLRLDLRANFAKLLAGGTQ